MITHKALSYHCACGIHRPREAVLLFGALSCPTEGSFASRITTCVLVTLSVFLPDSLPQGSVSMSHYSSLLGDLFKCSHLEENLCQTIPIVYYYYSCPRKGRGILSLCVRQSCILFSFVVCLFGFFTLLYLEIEFLLGLFCET